ncbi:unnamed protein product [Blepharisma stoltei]|uniref:C2H2-type domain-containing protein n=1 Tax=Blepharisma stoltei TaxID=1481888 RepID=A0AAU9JT29_9CILI|nr:unnamed protein product [Blepharisma stoltei]
MTTDNERTDLKLLPPPIDLCVITGLKTRNSLSCLSCGMMFRSQSDVEIHLLSENSTFPKFGIANGEETVIQYEKSALILPLFSSLDIEEKEEFVCQQCRLEFKSYKGMKQHIGKMHLTKYKHSKCPLCTKNFRHKYAVKFHIKQVHEKSTRASCKNCGREFYNKYLLNNHTKTCYCL